MVYDIVHDLREKNVEVQVFFVVHGCTKSCKRPQGAQNIVHQNFKFFEPCSDITSVVTI